MTGPTMQRYVLLVWTAALVLDILVDDSVVMKKLAKMRQDKAPGADDIQLRYLKEITEEICHALKNSSGDPTTPITGTICRPRARTCYNQPACQI